MTRLIPAILGLVLGVQSAYAATPENTLGDFIDTTKTFSATFEQVLVNAMGAIVEESHGEFFLSRPDKFRWNYAAPLPQDIVADGEHIWVFDKELEQITVNSQAESLNGASIALLAGNTEELTERFNISAGASERPNEKTVVLEPKEGLQEYEWISLTFRGDQLAKFQLKDSFGRTTLVKFNNISLNQVMKDGTFDLDAPEGVDVVRGTAGAQ